MLVPAGVRGRRGGRVRIGITAGARGVEPSQVLVPHQLLPRPELVEIVPGADTGLVPIREFGADRVMSYRLDLRNGDLALTDLQRFLARAVAATLRRWRSATEDFLQD